MFKCFISVLKFFLEDRQAFQANIYLFKVAIEIQEEGVKYVQSLQERPPNDAIDLKLC